MILAYLLVTAVRVVALGRLGDMFGRVFLELVSGPFHHALVTVFSAAAAMSLIGALTSVLHGRHHQAGPDQPVASTKGQEPCQTAPSS